MLAAESRLYALGPFDWAEVNLRRPITTQSQEEVLIKVHESKRNTVTAGFGFEVINRGGSVPSGTVAVPGLPPGRPALELPDQREDFLRSARLHRIHAPQSARYG